VPFPIWFIGGLLLVAAITYIFRDWERESGLLAAALIAGLGMTLWMLNLEQLTETNPTSNLIAAVERFAFSFQLTPSNAPVLSTVLLLGAFALLCGSVLRQGLAFVSLSIVLLAGYSALTLLSAAPLSPTLLAPLFLAVLSAVAIFIVQAGRPTYVGGPLRSFLPAVLALPLGLIAAWYIEQTPLNPQDDLLNRVIAPMLAIMFVLLSAPVPLHSAQPATAQTAPPVATALVTLLYQLAILQLLRRATLGFPVIYSEGVFSQLMALTGLLTALWGGMAAIGTGHLGKLWGYSALHDWGLILLVIATPGLRSWSLAAFLFGLRMVSMMTAATGLAAIEKSTGTLQASQLQGAGSRLPWSSAAYLLGGLGLVGFPLSAGFTGHWAALQLFAASDWRIAAAILIASAGAIIGYIRMARVLFGVLEDRTIFREKWSSVLLAAFALILSVSLAIVPQLLDGPISRTVAALTN
jgi:multicomponent Na+:H+ antiporter subunit D